MEQSSAGQSGLEHSEGGETPSASTEIERQVESAEIVEAPSLDRLPEALGYIETSQMQTLRLEWIAAIKANSPDARDLGSQYADAVIQLDAANAANFRHRRDQLYAWLTEDSAAQEGAPTDPTATTDALGFTPADVEELRTLRARLLIAQASSDESTQLVRAGDESPPDQAEALISAYQRTMDILEAEDGAKFRIGHLVTTATVWRDAGKPEFAREDLEDALQYAFARGLTEIEEMLESAIQTML